MGISRELLKTWCEGLERYQVREGRVLEGKGGLWCPVCRRFHGRCLDAFYPFLAMADLGEQRFLDAALLLYEWAEANVSEPDGSFLNDVDSDWKGITVFSVIQLAEAITHHGKILPPGWRERITERTRKGAEFLFDFKELEENNINYRAANCLAMYMAGNLLGEEDYLKKAEKLAKDVLSCVSEDGILLGEGYPFEARTPMGCAPVDMGYNIEESLPVLAQYAYLSQNRELADKVIWMLKSHERFVLDDGGIDDSFGTRNFKWTYWGSRTSDGGALGYLLFSDREKRLGQAASRMLQMLRRCTHNGLLYGGIYQYELGEPPCIHHTFTHAKVVAGILDYGLEERITDLPVQRPEKTGIYYYKDMALYRAEGPEYTADVTSYDWQYGDLSQGHAGGGMMILLWQKEYGPVLCSGMNEYVRKEPANMQLPALDHHECISFRIEGEEQKAGYSSLYDDCSSMYEAGGEPAVLEAEGELRNAARRKLEGGQGRYRIRYTFSDHRIAFQAEIPENACVVVPLVKAPGSRVRQEKNTLTIEGRADIRLTVTEGKLSLPYGEETIYNLVPGVEAVKVKLAPSFGGAGKLCWSVEFSGSHQAGA